MYLKTMDFIDEYVKLNLPVIPLCSHNHEGMSKKHKIKCKRPGKTPFLKEWQKRGVPSQEEVKLWKKSYRNRNIGLNLSKAGLVAIDLDGNQEEAEQLLKEISGGVLPDTWKFRTGSGAIRFLYKIPEKVTFKLKKYVIRNEEKYPSAKIELLGQGQQTVLPPSIHPNGKKYEWIPGYSPWDFGDPALAPSWMIELMKYEGSKKRERSKKKREGSDKRERSKKRAKKDLKSDYNCLYPNATKEDVEFLLNCCEFVRNYYSNPEGIGYDPWFGIGTIFYQLGPVGVDYYKDLSQRDSENWDEAVFEQKLEEFYIHPYGCKALGCKKDCGVKTPVDHLKNRFEEDIKPVVFTPLQVFKVHLVSEIGKSLQEKPAGITLIKMPPGTGKSHEIAVALRDAGASVVWAAPNHMQAEQILDLVPDAVHLKSREKMVEDGELDCPYVNEINKAYERGLPVKYMFCFNDEKPCAGEDCPYFNLYKKAREANFVVVMHDHLLTKVVKELDKKWLVIDENAAEYFRKTIEFTKDDIDYSLKIANFIKNKEHSSSIKRALKDLRDNKKISEKLPQLLLNDDIEQFSKNVIFAYKTLSEEGIYGRWLYNDIVYISENNAKIVFKNGVYKYSKKSWLPADRPIVILDATQTKERLEMLLPGCAIKEISLPGAIPEQHGEVIHVTSGRYPASSLFNKKGGLTKTGEKIIKVIEDNFGRQCAIITLKKVVEIAELDKKFKKVGWYGNIRGLNDFKDEETIAVAGFWMPPIDVLVKNALDQHGIIDADLEKEIEEAKKDFKKKHFEDLVTKDGRPYRVKTKKFSNPYVQNYYEYAILSELTQAVGRARIHLPAAVGKQRKIFIITSEPAEFIVPDHVIKLKDLKVDARKKESLKKIEQGLQLIEEYPPTPKRIHEVLKKIGVKIGIATIKRYYKTLLVGSPGGYCKVSKSNKYDKAALAPT